MKKTLPGKVTAIEDKNSMEKRKEETGLSREVDVLKGLEGWECEF